MKRLMFFLLFCGILLQQAQSQISWGPRVGLSTTTLDPETLTVSNVSLAIMEANYGFHLGLFFRAKLSDRVFLQPEVLFNSNSVDFKVNDLSSGIVDKILAEKYRNLDIPLMIGLKYGPIRLQAGPVGHVYIASSSELGTVGGYEKRFNDLNFGYQAGLGLDIWKILFDVKYEGNLTKFGDHMVIGGQNVKFDQRPTRFVFSAGFSF